MFADWSRGRLRKPDALDWSWNVRARGSNKGLKAVLAETIIGLFKAEVIHHLGPWRGANDVEIATLQWVHWFNNQRLLEPIGNIPPVEFEQMCYQQQSQLAA